MQPSSAILQEQVLLQQQQTAAFQSQQLFLQQYQPNLHLLHLSPLNSPLSSPLTSPSSPQGYFFQQSENTGSKILLPSLTIHGGNTGIHFDLSNYGQQNMGETFANNSQHNMLPQYQISSNAEQNNFSASFPSRKVSEQVLPTLSRSHSKLDPTSNGLSQKKSSKFSLNNQRITENQNCEQQPRNKYLQAREEHYRKLLQRLPIVKLSFTSYQDILFHWENVKGHVENVPGGIAILVSLPYMQQVKIDLVPIKSTAQTVQEKLSNFWKLFGFSTNNTDTSEREEDVQLNPRSGNYLDDTEESVLFEHRQQKRPLPSLFAKRPSKVKELDSKSAKSGTKQNSLDDILEKDISTSSVSQRLLLRIHAQRAPRMLQTLQPDSLDRPYNLEYHGEFELDFRLPPSLLHWYNQRSTNPLSEDAWMELLSKRCLSHRYNKHTGLLMVYIDDIRTRRSDDGPLPAVKPLQPQPVSLPSENLLDNAINAASSSSKPPLPTDNSIKIAIQKNTNADAPPANTHPLPSTPFQPLPPTNFSPDGFVLPPSSNVKSSLPPISDAKINDIVITTNKNQNISNDNSDSNMLNVSESQRLSPEIPILSNPHLYYDDYSSVSSSDYGEDEDYMEDANDRDNNQDNGDNLSPNIPSTPHKEVFSSSSKPPMPPSSSNKTKKKLSKAEKIIAKEQQRRKKYSNLDSSPHRKKKSNVVNNAANNKSSNNNILANLFPSFSSPTASSAKTFNKNVSNNSMKSNNTSTNNMSQTTSNNSSNNTSHNNMSSHNTSNSNIKSHNTSHNNIQSTSDNDIALSDKPVSHSQLTEASPLQEDTKNRVYVRSVSQPAAVHRPQLIGEFVPKQLSPLSNPRLSVSNKTRSATSVQNETAASVRDASAAGVVDPGLTKVGKKSPLPLLKQSLHNMYRSRPSDTETQQDLHRPLETHTDVFQADRYEDLYLGAMSFDDEEIQYKHYSPQMMASFSRSEDDFDDDY